MTSRNEEVLRLLGEVRRTKGELDYIERQLRQALGEGKEGIPEKAIKWLLAALIEKPVRRLVDEIFNRLDKWRAHRKSEGF